MAKLFHTGKYNELFRQGLFLAALIATGLIIFLQLKFFVGAALGAFTLYVVFRGWMFHITEQWHWKPWIAGLSLTTLCLVILSGIGFGAYQVIAKEMPDVDASQIVTSTDGLVDRVNGLIGFDAVPDDVLQKSGGVATKIVGAVLNTTYSFAANIFMMLIIVYFMFTKGRKMECYAYRFSPFKGESLSTIKREVKNIVYSNAIGIPVIMVAQTITSAFIYWAVGMDSYLFWGFLTALCGLIPLVGSGIVYMLLGVYYIATGDIWTAVIIVLYGVIIISNTDNVIRIVLMKKVNNTHPLIVIFGVIIGIPMFGFWGIIFGPLFLSVFFLLIRIYYTEYRLLRSQKDAEIMANLSFADNPAPLRSVNKPVIEDSTDSLATARVDEKAVREAHDKYEARMLHDDPCDCVGVQPKPGKKKGSFLQRLRRDRHEND